MRIGNGSEEDARGRSVDPFAERLVRIYVDDVIVAGKDPRNLINAVFTNLDAFAPNGGQTKPGLPSQGDPCSRLEMTSGRVSREKPCDVLWPRNSTS